MTDKVRRLLLSLLAVIIVAAISLSPFWLGVQQLTQPWLRPIATASWSLGEWFRNVWGLPILVEQNEVLRHEVAELMARQATSQTVYKENEELRKLLNLPESPGYERLAVEIIGQQVDETGTSYLINRGLNDGLSVGLAVVAGSTTDDSATAGLVLVGTITRVGVRVANLRLITSSSSEVLATLADDPTAQSLAVGEYNLAVRLRYLPIDRQVAIGDAVITSNLSAIIPPGLLIGTVTTVEQTEGQLFQSAIVSPPVPLEQFRFMYVLNPFNKP